MQSKHQRKALPIHEDLLKYRSLLLTFKVGQVKEANELCLGMYTCTIILSPLDETGKQGPVGMSIACLRNYYLLTTDRYIKI